MAHVEGGGLQRHSVGDLYPLIIVGYGSGKWGIIDTPMGLESGPIYDTQGEAVHDATRIKERYYRA